MSEISDEAREVEPESGEAPAERIEEVLAGKHRGEGELEDCVEVAAARVDEQDPTAVLDCGREGEVDDPLAMAARHERVDEVLAHAVPGHAGPMCGGDDRAVAPALLPGAERDAPSATTALRWVAS